MAMSAGTADAGEGEGEEDETREETEIPLPPESVSWAEKAELVGEVLGVEKEMRRAGKRDSSFR
jgi:hypothetical protein